jgi:hypothetical protein
MAAQEPAGEEPAGQLPAMRASDADRERVVAVLQAALGDGRITVDEFGERSAAAYAGRTQDELAALTRDLGVVPSSLDALPTERAAETGPPVVAVFSGARRKGRWHPARRETAVAVFGGIEIDLREARLPAGGMRLSAVAVFGGIDVTVPEGTRVELSGFSVFGGREVSGDEGPPGAFVLHVHAVAVFGGVNVKVTGPQRRP